MFGLVSDTPPFTTSMDVGCGPALEVIPPVDENVLGI